MMKKILLALFAIASFTEVHATLDTVSVMSHQDVVIKTDPSIGQTFYPQWATFPSGSEQYRKVLIRLKFECAPGLKCGEWDYINNISIGRTGGVNNSNLNYEIARLITPQGGYWNATTGWNHTWYYDVTDFAYLLHDSVEVIYRHSGYEPNNDRGWKINLQFICVKGTPAAEPVAINKLWGGSFTMGDASDTIENHLVPFNTTLTSQTNLVRFTGIHTGHGSNSGGCMEYCRKYRKLIWDGTVIDQRAIWRSDCGYNSVYPQSGAWLYDRAGWCPGSPVRYDNFNVMGLTSGSTHSIDMDMEPYSVSTDFGELNSTAYLIQYKAPANTQDVSIENILAPSSESEFVRMNPICNDPIVVIKNNGSSPLTSAKIEYGVVGGTMVTYQWTGNLAFMQNDTVTLTNPVQWNAKSGKFVATIKEPNGQADQFADDNSMTSDFVQPNIFPNKIIISFLSNKDASENWYKVVNASTHQTVYQKNNFKNETQYNDTLNLSPGNCYYFYFSDEDTSTSSNRLNKDGLDFAPFTASEGTGSLKIKNAYSGVMLKDVTNMTAGPYGTKGGDFGARYTLYFMSVFNLGTSSVAGNKTTIDVYPNPGKDMLYVDYSVNGNDNRIYLIDMQGRIMYSTNVAGNTGTEPINISTMPAGIYILKFVAGDDIVMKKVIKN